MKLILRIVEFSFAAQLECGLEDINIAFHGIFID
jgi:hypothetical protein